MAIRRAVYLGPAGTYSHEAARRAFAESTLVPAASLRLVVEMLAEGKADCAVLPVENSTNGVVYAAVQALIDYSNVLEVTGEVRVPIKHQLYTKEPDLASIRTVYSHSQVWGQTDKWLRKHLPHAKRENCDSTAKAVQIALASEAGAALAGPCSSPTEALVQNCSDDPSNTTRFLVLSRIHAGSQTVGSQSESQSAASQNVSESPISKSQNESVQNESVPHTYAVVKNSTINSVLRECREVKFLAMVPASEAWHYHFFIELETDVPEEWISLSR